MRLNVIRGSQDQAAYAFDRSAVNDSRLTEGGSSRQLESNPPLQPSTLPLSPGSPAQHAADRALRHPLPPSSPRSAWLRWPWPVAYPEDDRQSRKNAADRCASRRRHGPPSHGPACDSGIRHPNGAGKNRWRQVPPPPAPTIPATAHELLPGPSASRGLGP